MKKRAGILILVQFIVVIASLCLAALFLQQGSADGIANVFRYLYDTVPLLLLFVMALPPMLVHGIWKDFLRVFRLGSNDRNFSICEIKKTLLAIELLQKQIIYGTVMIVCVYAVILLMNLEEISALGPNLAVNLDVVIYMAIALLFIEPLKAYTQRYLEDYLAEEED